MKKLKYLIFTIVIFLISISVDAATLGYKNDLILGDVDRSGKIDSADAQIIYDAIFEGTEMSEIKKVMADVNMDGVVNYVDRKYIVKYANKSIDCFPNLYDPGCATNEIKTELLGDINQDGKIDSKDVDAVHNLILKGEENITAKELRLGDVNLDGELTALDLLKIQKQVLEAKNLEVNQKISSYKYGDLNIDEKIDSGDLNLLIETLYKNNPNRKDKFLGDLNSDKKVDRTDGLILINYLEKRISSIPISTAGFSGAELDPNIIKNGDTNYDNSIDENDLTFIENCAKTNNSLTPIDKFKADINSDGVVNSKDVDMMKSMLGITDSNDGNNDSQEEDDKEDNKTPEEDNKTPEEDNKEENVKPKEEKENIKDKNEPSPDTGDIFGYLVIGIFIVSGIGFVAYHKIKTN